MKQTQERRQQKNTQKEGGMQMKYKVTLRYIDMTFDDGMEALKFARQGKLHADETMRVCITLIDDEEEEEA